MRWMSQAASIPAWVTLAFCLLLNSQFVRFQPVPSAVDGILLAKFLIPDCSNFPFVQSTMHPKTARYHRVVRVRFHSTRKNTPTQRGICFFGKILEILTQNGKQQRLVCLSGKYRGVRWIRRLEPPDYGFSFCLQQGERS